jgi:sugar phosphate isomerase/epimerase
MQIGVSSYSFSRLVGKGEMTELDVVAKAKEMGFDTLEFASIRVPDGTTLRDYAKRLREACEAVGFRIANYTIPADFINGSDGNLASEIERVKEEVRVAEILGAPGMRHDATYGYTPDYAGNRSFDAALPRLVEGCRAITEFAAELGIKTMVENHGYFCQDSDRVEKLIAAVDRANFGALIDMGNFLCVDEDPGKAIGRLMPYAFHVHAKDFHAKPGTASNPGEGWFPSRGGNYLRGSIIGHGDVPLLQCLRVMKRANFEGVLSIEFEGMEDPIEGIRIGLQNLRALVATAYA